MRKALAFTSATVLGALASTALPLSTLVSTVYIN